MKQKITESIIKKQCRDCGTSDNLVHLIYKDESEELDVYKCEECFDKNPGIDNYKRTEVFSRIVGYIRPVRDYNKGKAQEFKERKTFKV